MLKHKKTFIILILTILLIACGSGNSSNNNHNSDVSDSKYLTKPIGQYNIGFKDFYFIDNKRCPDLFYSNYQKDTEQYFDIDNLKHCRQIITRVYYPTITVIRYSLYYPILSKQLPNTFINSFSTNSAPIASGTFPVIIFAPGKGTQTQLYENFITELVSNGYIVVGMNSPFIDSNIILQNNTVVPSVEPYHDGDSTDKFYTTIKTIYFPTITKDIEFVYSKIISRQSFTQDISNAMDTKSIGALGHSIGTEGIRIATLRDKLPLKAVATLDLTSPMGEPYNPLVDPSIGVFNIPILNIGSAQQNIIPNNDSLTQLNMDTLLTNLGGQGYLVFLTPSLSDNQFSTHMNLSDYSTLQYEPLIAEYFKNKKVLLGNGNGYNMTNSVNSYLLTFFDFYLNNKGNGLNPSSECNPLTGDTVLKCGKFKY